MIESIAHKPIIESKPLAFDSQLHIAQFQEIKQLKGTIPPEKFSQRFLMWQHSTLIDLETNIGERYNAILFKVDYPFNEGRMIHPFRNEFALDTVIKGQQHRLRNSSHLNHDQKRELSEVVSFSTAEEYFRENPNTSNRLIIPSPPGGNYHNNFIDVFELGEKNKVVRLSRVAITTSLKKHLEIVEKLTNEQIPNVHPIDVELKSFVVTTEKSLDEILLSYNPDKKALSLEDYKKLKEIYRPCIKEYLKAIIQGKSKSEIEKKLKSGYKFADIYMGKDVDETGIIQSRQTYKPQEIPQLLPILETQSVRTISTPCGIQGGSSVNNRGLIFESLFGSIEPTISSSNEDQYGTLKIHCEECGKTYNRTSGELEDCCRYCGGTKGITC